MGDVYLPTGEGCSLIYWVIMTDSCRAMTCLKTVLELKKKKRKLHSCMFKDIFLKNSV